MEKQEYDKNRMARTIFSHWILLSRGATAQFWPHRLVSRGEERRKNKTQMGSQFDALFIFSF